MHLAMDNHKAIYSNPIQVEKGDVIVLSGRADNWDGHQWLWAKAVDGREGWVPDSLPINKAGKICAAYSYSAIELDVNSGDRLDVLAKSQGWAWCANDNEIEGWVPLKVLAPC